MTDIEEPGVPATHEEIHAGTSTDRPISPAVLDHGSTWRMAQRAGEEAMSELMCVRGRGTRGKEHIAVNPGPHTTLWSKTVCGLTCLPQFPGAWDAVPEAEKCKNCRMFYETEVLQSRMAENEKFLGNETVAPEPIGYAMDDGDKIFIPYPGSRKTGSLEPIEAYQKANPTFGYKAVPLYTERQVRKMVAAQIRAEGEKHAHGSFERAAQIAEGSI